MDEKWSFVAKKQAACDPADRADDELPGYRCPFCALAAGTPLDDLHSTPDDVVCRTDLALAFVASRWWANNPGHVLIVPVRHAENLYELPDDAGAAIAVMSRRVARAIRASYGCGGVSTRQHNEPAGYQTVWHYHLHVFPRHAGDGLYPADDRSRPTTPDERRPYAVKLRAALAADPG